MDTMNISLPDELRINVEQKMKSGAYSTASEYIKDLIRKDFEREQLRNLILEGVESPLGSIVGEKYLRGKTEINKGQWSLIKSALLILKSKVDHARNLRERKPDLFNFKFIRDDYLQEMAKKFSKSQPLFSKMISDFITWIDENIQKYGSIYILRI